MKYKTVSIDLAKNIFQVCALDNNHKVKMNKKVSRNKLLDTLRQLEPTTVVMEACYSANPWGRAIEKLGHTVKLIPPYMVKPFVIGNKNDCNDALGIAEASLRPKIRFVPVKTLAQQDVQSLQRIQSRMIRSRTATSNQLRGLLAEYWIVLPTGLAQLKKQVPDILEDAEQPLTPVARQFVDQLHREILKCDEQIQEITDTIAQLLNDNEDYKLLQSIPGIGPKIAATFVASVGNAHHFKNGRQLAAWIGLTPKQHSSGDKQTMGGMTKRGNQELRRLLIHGARAVMNWADKKTDTLSLWIQSLSKRAHPCKVIVALANKLARIAWAVLAYHSPYLARTD